MNNLSRVWNILKEAQVTGLRQRGGIKLSVARYRIFYSSYFVFVANLYYFLQEQQTQGCFLKF